VLDRYHQARYVTQATGHIEGSAAIMWKYIHSGEKKLRQVFAVLITAIEGEAKKPSVGEARNHHVQKPA
jgi:hypothetical protein